jgi:hypothetical protein
MRWDSRTLATKDERHRLVTKCHSLGFETRVPLSVIAGDFGEPFSEPGPTWTELLRAAERGGGGSWRKTYCASTVEAIASFRGPAIIGDAGRIVWICQSRRG